MTKEFLKALLSVLFFTTLLPPVSAAPDAETRQENYSLSKKGLALGGYDPVSYFKKGPAKGSSKISFTYEGVTYHFANAANLKAFKANPEKYEPQYGGWCAWAMYDDGGRTKPDPKSYTITNGKLYVFYDGFLADTLKFWNDAAAKSSEAALIAKADRQWQRQIGN